ncbi:MAG: aminotransferase class V-fold PLP-dependent enzyme, partial [Clostridia bacterium]|nr:aminotransferase class V-fold PLP-dependent enzyme [Clostridia bacterium]
SQTALKSAEKFNDENFFNASALYRGGLEQSNAIKEARNYILSTLGGTSKHELIFTSCGSESDNQAIFCAAKRGVFVTTKGEHSAVYKSFFFFLNRGLTVEFIGLNKDGSVNEDELYSFIKNNPQASFVSIVHVNNETGAINDVNKIAENVKKINPSIIFHSDGVQAYGKINYRLNEYVDLYSLSAHKINALKGTGALIKKKNLNLNPLIYGGGQESGLRSGTENVFGIKVFEYAARERFSVIRDKIKEVSLLKTAFKERLDSDNFTVISGENSSPYILSVSAKGLRGEVIMHSLETEGIIVGNGSACSSKNRYSRVLEACGYGKDVLDGVVRISFSNETTMDEVVFAAEKLNETVVKLKKIM